MKHVLACGQALAWIFLCLLIVGVARASVSVSGEWQVTLLKGTTAVTPVSTGATQESAWSACTSRIPKPEAVTATTTGKVKYTCQTPRFVAYATYSANPVCPTKPADETQTATCPAGATGSWSQVRTYITAAPPECWTASAWTPASPPVGACVADPATVSWVAPAAYTDGTAITDLAGYRVAYGHSASVLDKVVQVNNPAATSYELKGLAAGTWYFAVRAYTSTGTESAPSNVVSKVIL